VSHTSLVRPSAARRLTLRRLLAVVLLLLSSVSLLAPPAAADVRPHRITTAQERVVLRLIDDICGDTWCEGDHALRFTRFSCHSKRASCLLAVRIASRSQEPLQWRRRSYPVRGSVRYTDMVSTGPDGTRSLQPAFLEAVGHAVRVMQSSVR
jgi:hypothetical protein